MISYPRRYIPKITSWVLMRTSYDLEGEGAKDGKPRKPRTFAAQNYEHDCFKLYVDLVVTAFCELLGIERRELATEAGLTPPYLSAILRHSPLTAETVESLDAAMNRLVQKHIERASADNPLILPQQLVDARTLVSVGLDRRARILMSMSRSAPTEAISPYEDQERTLIAMLVNGQYLRDRQTNPEIILPLVQKAFPQLPAGELGFAYSAVARAVLNASERDFETARYTSALFELASQHYGASMAWSLSMLIRSDISTIKRAECSADERTAILKRLNLIIGELELFSLRLPIPLTQVAHDLKLLGECLEFIAAQEGKTDEATTARWKAEFQRASKLYDIEIDRFQPDASPSLKRGDLLLNAGYCKMKSVGGGVQDMKRALVHFVESNSAAKIAYTFKMLSMAHLADADADAALRCARMSVKIYQRVRPNVAKADIDHAELHLRDVEGSKFLSARARRAVIETDDPITLAKIYLTKNRPVSGS